MIELKSGALRCEIEPRLGGCIAGLWLDESTYDSYVVGNTVADNTTSGIQFEISEKGVVAGPDPEQHLAELRKYIDAGYDEVYVANMGPNYLAMIEGWGRDVLPGVRA